MNIIINGGTRGIGRELVSRMSYEGSNRLIVTGRNEKILAELAAENTNIRCFVLDLSNIDSRIDEFTKLVTGYFGKVDVLINMAGYLVARDFTEFTEKEARMIMETNFFGPATLIRALLPLMTKGSHIVNISSMGGYQGSVKFRGLSYYSASKAALACLTECLSMEFKDSGISVNCLALGSVETEMLNEAFPGFKAPVSALQMAEYIADFARNGHKFYNGKILPVALGNP